MTHHHSYNGNILTVLREPLDKNADLFDLGLVLDGNICCSTHVILHYRRPILPTATGWKCSGVDTPESYPQTSSPLDICMRLNTLCSTKKVFVENCMTEMRWIVQIYKAAGQKLRFRYQPIKSLLDAMDSDHANRYRQKLFDRLPRGPMRAIDKAVLIADCLDELTTGHKPHTFAKVGNGHLNWPKIEEQEDSRPIVG